MGAGALRPRRPVPARGARAGIAQRAGAAVGEGTEADQPALQLALVGPATTWPLALSNSARTVLPLM